MAIVGPNGNDLPEFIAGVPGRDWAAIKARVFTDLGREPYSPKFGVGIAQALGNPVFPPGILFERFVESLDGTELSVDEFTVEFGDRTYVIDTSFSRQDGI